MATTVTIYRPCVDGDMENGLDTRQWRRLTTSASRLQLFVPQSRQVSHQHCANYKLKFTPIYTLKLHYCLLSLQWDKTLTKTAKTRVTAKGISNTFFTLAKFPRQNDCVRTNTPSYQSVQTLPSHQHLSDAGYNKYTRLCLFKWPIF